ncbi:MAG: TIGR04219 family outer membrane beta-barrel protein, partial [Gammaproteobacteria bacterium]|nr:TIGR04219 family outer membrane beta-barrel protein [Gammaproteobacteria bacterium]
MKKQLLSLCLPVVLACTSFSASAAMILGFDAGVYVWQTSTTGTVGVDDSAGMEGDNNVAYFAFEHPIPFVPNVKLQTTDMVAASGTNTIDLSHTDSILYYEILDNFISVDIGLTSRAFDGSYDFGTPQAMTDTSILLYGSAEVIIPITGLSAGMEVHQDFGADDNKISDIKIRVRYEILGG